MNSAEPSDPHRSCVQKIYENIDQGDLTAPTNGRRTVLKPIVTLRTEGVLPCRSFEKNVREVINAVINCFFFVDLLNLTAMIAASIGVLWKDISILDLA